MICVDSLDWYHAKRIYIKLRIPIADRTIFGGHYQKKTIALHFECRQGHPASGPGFHPPGQKQWVYNVKRNKQMKGKQKKNANLAFTRL